MKEKSEKVAVCFRRIILTGSEALLLGGSGAHE